MTGGNGGAGGKSLDGAGDGGSGGIGLLFTNREGAIFVIGAAVRGGAGGVSDTSPSPEMIKAVCGRRLSCPWPDPAEIREGRNGPGGVGISGQNLRISIFGEGSVAGGSGADAINLPGA